MEVWLDIPCLKDRSDKSRFETLATRIDNETTYINMDQTDFDAYIGFHQRVKTRLGRHG